MSHKYEEWVYCLCFKKQFAEMLTKGFDGGTYSDDGNWVINDKGSRTNMNTWCVYDESLVPQWMLDMGVTGCCLTYELAHKIITDPRYRIDKDSH